MKTPVRARVKNGRLRVDEPTDLPEGTELYLVPTVPSARSQRAAIRRYIEAYRERPETEEEKAAVRKSARRALARVAWEP
jgi:hypothetical protein